MPRPQRLRKIRANPNSHYFKPQGIPMRDLQEIILLADEWEAIRLKNCENLQQVSAAKKMGISQSTFQRILASAYAKISQALVEGKAIRIPKN
ncbi:MAG: DUF134 domain-containing protein [Candidatus Gracilibacteria bacterium]|nr:DUF134 domain-containing protein [Candidatus Gracilibacteria bacterium]MDD5178818.1 DUF134 domain-containing protein [Candidatus Gracilibacteria bacterium]